MNLVHVVNVEIKDNHEEATLGSFIIYDLVEKVNSQTGLQLIVNNIQFSEILMAIYKTIIQFICVISVLFSVIKYRRPCIRHRHCDRFSRKEEEQEVLTFPSFLLSSVHTGITTQRELK